VGRDAFEIGPPREEQDRVRLPAKGDLDMLTVPELEHSLRQFQRAGKALTLDLTDLRFIDSSGVRLLLRTSRAAPARGWEFRIAHPVGEVARVIDVLGVGPLLNLDD
jgi:anti-sigma B factor antagonist